MRVEELQGAFKMKTGRVIAALPLKLLLLGIGMLVLSILLKIGDGMPDGTTLERSAHTPEVSPYRFPDPFRVHNTSHASLHVPLYTHTIAGWMTYLASTIPAWVALLIGRCTFPEEPVRQIQFFELVQVVGMLTSGAFSGYPRYPVPTKYHGTNSPIAQLTRLLLPTWLLPIVLAILFGRFKQTQYLVDITCAFYVILDGSPSFVNHFHVNERPTHNLRLLVLSVGTMASRHRAFGAIMGMFYICTGVPKLFPSFYRYWLWFGIYPSSTLADFPTWFWFSIREDGGLHPNFMAQALGFFGGALETLLAVLLLVPRASNKCLRRWLAVGIHLGIIFGRFDNGLAGWNAFWLCEDVLHTAGPVHSASWTELGPVAGAVVAAQGTLSLLFFLGHGSYHSGMSHHTGNFRMQWLLFRDDAAWEKFEVAMRPIYDPVCLDGPTATCVHTWGHGTHYPGLSFATFLYALNGGTYLPEVLPAGVAAEEPGFQFGEWQLMVGQVPAEKRKVLQDLYAKERPVRVASHSAFMEKVNALTGGFNWTSVVEGRPRAIYLGFASGASIWDDAFYEPLAAETVRDMVLWKPGEVKFIEVDRQRPWRRTRRLRSWDLSRDLPPTPRSFIDRLLGSSPGLHLVEEKLLVVRRPFPFT